MKMKIRNIYLTLCLICFAGGGIAFAAEPDAKKTRFQCVKTDGETAPAGETAVKKPHFQCVRMDGDTAFAWESVGASDTESAKRKLSPYISLKASIFRQSKGVEINNLYGSESVVPENTNPLRGALGLQYNKILRAEIEYTDNGIKPYNFTAGLPGNFLYSDHSYSYLANIYYDFKTEGKLSPYVGLGLGYGRIKNTNLDWMTGATQNNTLDAFVWQAGAGLSYALSESLALDFGYRYIDFGSKTIDGTTSSSPPTTFKIQRAGSEFSFGFRFNF